jgi:hypothetical protein
MLTIRNRIAQSLWGQGYELDENFLVSKTHRLVLVSNILLLWILGLLHLRESDRNLKMLTGLGMIETIPLQCLYVVHKDNFNFNFSATSCYHIVFNNVCDTDVILTGLK